LDANVILRYILKDDPKQSPIAAAIFNRSQATEIRLLVSAIILSEVFYVLTRTRGMSRLEAAKLLLALISTRFVHCSDNVVVVTDALRRIGAKNVSFGDAYLAALAVHQGEPVASFDHHLAGFQDVEIYKPKTS